MKSRIDPKVLSLDEPKEIVERITRFLKTHAERIGAKNLVVGLSGGLDSSVAAALCSLAVGGTNTIGLWIQEKESFNASSLRDAMEVADNSGIRIKKLDMTALAESIADLVHPDKRGRVQWGNAKARLRAMILYYYANSHNGLVVGTGDKSEIMLGYFTKYGDGACDLQPLADIYKTSLKQLARYLKIPNRISSKPSTPELWPGQTAERELGLPYHKLDLILWGLERWMTPEEISQELSIPLRNINAIRTRWLLSEHKRRPPLAMKLGFRTAGQDLRIPYNI